jgi:hypothetical protein
MTSRKKAAKHSADGSTNEEAKHLRFTVSVIWIWPVRVTEECKKTAFHITQKRMACVLYNARGGEGE